MTRSDDYMQAGASEDVEFAVVVLTGAQAGAEVTTEGVPWRGSLHAARVLVVDMTAQARRFGHDDATYAVECMAPIPPCACGHLWSSHDAGGCHYQDGCKENGE